MVEKKELEYFNKAFQDNLIEGVHIGLQGPRRAGKTALVRHFFEKKAKEFSSKNIPLFKLILTGDDQVSDLTNCLNTLQVIESALKAFSEENHISYTRFEQEIKVVSEFTWKAIFHYLMQSLLAIRKRLPEIKVLIFFDEINWFSKNPQWFLSGYSSFLNNQQESFDFVMTFIACSSTGWYVKAVQHNVKGLHRRIEHFSIQPFNLPEMFEFFSQNNWSEDKSVVLDYYLLFGGYIKHYNHLKRELDLNQPLKNQIHKLKELNAYLLREFGDLFRNIFREETRYKKILSLICQHKCLSAEELKVLYGDISINHLQRSLKELVDGELLQRLPHLEKGNTFNYFCPIPIIHLNVITDEFSRWDAFENAFYSTRGNLFETLVIQKSITLAQKENAKLIGMQANKVLRNCDLIEDGDKKVALQLDLIIRTQSNSRRSEQYLLYEIKSFSTKETIELEELLEIDNKIFQAYQANKRGKSIRSISVQSKFVGFEGGSTNKAIDFLEL